MLNQFVISSFSVLVWTHGQTYILPKTIPCFASIACVQGKDKQIKSH